MEKILRIIDANFNRAREGLRVIEDAVRFYYELDAGYVKDLKSLRHALSKSTAETFALPEMRAARNSVDDGGKTFDSRKKEDIALIIEKNFMRTGEAIRTIEEYSKTKGPFLSRMFHDMRFELYRIEKEISLKIRRRSFPLPFVYIMTTFHGKGENVAGFIKSMAEARPDFIEINYCGENTGAFLNIAKKARKLIPEDILYIISGRIDICLLCRADGLSIRRGDIPLKEARKLLPDRIIGFSAESLKEIPACMKRDFDYIVCPAARDIPKTAILTETLKKVNIPCAFTAEKGASKKRKRVPPQAAHVHVPFGIALIAEPRDNPAKIIREFKTRIKKHGK